MNRPVHGGRDLGIPAAHFPENAALSRERIEALKIAGNGVLAKISPACVAEASQFVGFARLFKTLQIISISQQKISPLRCGAKID